MIAIPNIDKLHPALKALAVALPAILIAVPLYLLVCKPNIDKINKLKTEIKAIDKEIATARDKLGKLSGLKKARETAEKEYGEIKKQLPEENEITDLLGNVQARARSSGLKIISWIPQGKINYPKSNILYEIPVNVELQGSYHNLGDFFSKITSLSRIVTIGKFDVSRVSLTGEALSIKLGASTYSTIPKTPDEVKGK